MDDDATTLSLGAYQLDSENDDGDDDDVQDCTDSSSNVDDDVYTEVSDTTDWARHVREVLGRLCVSFEGPLRLLTLCSGTDSFVHSAHEIMQERREEVVHHLACDHAAAAAQFIKWNFQPRHFYHEVSCINKEDPCCCICQGPCDARHVDCHIGCAGFPCTPYSCLLDGRFDADDDPWTHKEASVISISIS